MDIKLDDIVYVIHPSKSFKENTFDGFAFGKIVRLHDDGKHVTVEVDGLRAVHDKSSLHIVTKENLR